MPRVTFKSTPAYLCHQKRTGSICTLSLHRCHFNSRSVDHYENNISRPKSCRVWNQFWLKDCRVRQLHSFKAARGFQTHCNNGTSAHGELAAHDRVMPIRTDLAVLICNAAHMTYVPVCTLHYTTPLLFSFPIQKIICDDITPSIWIL